MFLDWVRKCIARNLRVSGSLVEPKAVALVRIGT